MTGLEGRLRLRAYVNQLNIPPQMPLRAFGFSRGLGKGNGMRNTYIYIYIDIYIYTYRYKYDANIYLQRYLHTQIISGLGSPGSPDSSVQAAVAHSEDGAVAPEASALRGLCHHLAEGGP